jgi:hypothetical protein
MASRQTRILILCKTYPSPSGKHVEMSCVAGMEQDGRLVRLFPIPFRLIDDDKGASVSASLDCRPIPEI